MILFYSCLSRLTHHLEHRVWMQASCLFSLKRDVWGMDMELPFHKNNSHLQNDMKRDMSLGAQEEAAWGNLLAV